MIEEQNGTHKVAAQKHLAQLAVLQADLTVARKSERAAVLRAERSENENRSLKANLQRSMEQRDEATRKLEISRKDVEQATGLMQKMTEAFAAQNPSQPAYLKGRKGKIVDGTVKDASSVAAEQLQTLTAQLAAVREQVDSAERRVDKAQKEIGRLLDEV